MAGYVIADIDVTDPVRYEEYRRLASATVSAFGGEYVVRGGACETVEGNWIPRRLVVLRFDSVERAKEWWASEEYRPAKELRQETAATNLIIVDGP
jgi:uncharacterized protein (DUF1330 family)